MGKNKDKTQQIEEESSVLAIDPNHLDEEWLEQPQLLYLYSRKLADARAELEEQKQELDLIKAETDRDIRSDPSSYDMEKITEAAVEKAIALQEGYQAQIRIVANCRHKVDIFQAMVNALEHRKRALEHLVTLHGQQYFASPTARTPEDREAMEARQKDKIRRQGQKRKGD